MLAGIRELEDLPLIPFVTESFPARGRTVPLLSSILAAVSAALVREEDKVQKPMYYTSQALHGAEERYPPMEKLAFALVTIARKLKPYFQAHMVIVLTNKPLRRAISNPEATERMALWAIELSEFNIQYRSRIAIKGQVIIDFIVEFTNIEC